MKLNLHFSGKSIIKFATQRIIMIILILLCGLAGWLAYISYNNVYLTVLSPKEINPNEITAKKQKVNLELFNQINSKIKDKQNVNSTSLNNIKNPF